LFSFAAISSSDISLSSFSSADDGPYTRDRNVDYDQSYQYANKSDVTTSPGEEDTDIDVEAPRNFNTNRFAAVQKPVQYETLDIFNVSLSDNEDDEDLESVVLLSGEDPSSTSYYYQYHYNHHPDSVTSQSAYSDDLSSQYFF
jgi:hypothetical protein